MFIFYLQAQQKHNKRKGIPVSKEKEGDTTEDDNSKRKITKVNSKDDVHNEGNS